MLEGKTAVITGCLTGIGRTTLDKFAENHANIVACSYAKTDEFENHIEELKSKFGVEIYPVYFDMRDDNSVKEAAHQIQKLKLKIDALINIAGVAEDALFQMITKEQMLDTFQINFFSQIIFTQYIVRMMQRTGGGSIVFTTSITGEDGNRGQLVYGATKAALIEAAKTMSEELGPLGFKVNAVAPGIFDTPMFDNVPSEVIDRILAKSCMKRKGLKEEVADVYMFLTSELSSYVTGQVIRVDGGVK